MYQLSSFLCKWMYRENAILEDDFETCQYGLLITIANIINFLIMLLVGVLCGTVWEMGMFYMVFISLRLFCGGYHAGSYGKCFLLFGLTCLLGMSGARCFSRYVFGSFCFFLVLAIFFGVCIYKKAPVEHRNRLLSGSEKNCFKREGHRGARGGWRDSRACGLFLIYMRFMSRSRASFWSSFKVLHAAKRVRCSSVNSAGVFPSEKNCDKVIPNARHTASRVGMVGALLRLKRFVMVDWERPASLPSR